MKSLTNICSKCGVRMTVIEGQLRTIVSVFTSSGTEMKELEKK